MEEIKMPKKRRNLRDYEARKQFARTTKRRLALLIAFLSTIVLALLLRVGETWWPAWMIEHQTQIVAGISFVMLCILLASPIVIEADSNPRTLSGPGKNPKGPRVD